MAEKRTIQLPSDDVGQRYDEFLKRTGRKKSNTTASLLDWFMQRTDAERDAILRGSAMVMMRSTEAVEAQQKRVK